ncbi:MAG TPA: Flp family type IVb pilin [Acidimicrobiia bacterium]|jgi:Flp pilus assembly pilin Flp
MKLYHLSLVAASWFAPKSGEERERGASMVEYALLVVLIALIAFVAVRFAGQELSRTYSTIAGSVSSN